MRKYPWADNAFKLERAIAATGTNATEEQVKERYVALGGRVLPSGQERKEPKARIDEFEKVGAKKKVDAKPATVTVEGEKPLEEMDLAELKNKAESMGLKAGGNPAQIRARIEKAIETQTETKEYDGPMGEYKVTGEIEACDQDGKPTGVKLEVGSVQKVPTALGEAWVSAGTAEVVGAGAEGDEDEDD